MSSELTSTYTTDDWLKAIEGQVLLIKSEEPSDTDIIRVPLADNNSSFQRDDLELPLRKVSHQVKK